MFCSQCGVQAIRTARFCQVCGAELIKQNNVNEVSPSSARISKVIPPQEGSKITEGQTDIEVPIDQSKKFFGGTYYPWRRYLARTLDLLCIVAPIIQLLIQAEAYLPIQKLLAYFGTNPSPYYIVPYMAYLLSLPIEAGFLAYIGATPGKCLFGIQVLSREGVKLSYGSALKRSIQVIVVGEGLSIPVVNFITRLISYNKLTKSGTTAWDTSINCIVLHGKWSLKQRIVAFLFILTTCGLVNEVNVLNFFIPLKSYKVAEDINLKKYDESSDQKILAKDIFNIYQPKIATILLKDAKGETIATGSGVIVDSEGSVLTNSHVVIAPEAEEIDVEFSNGISFSNVPISGIHKNVDLALLKLPNNYISPPPVSQNELSPGEKVFTISNPEGYTNSVSEGIVSGVRQVSGGYDLVQITAAVSPGSSGGAVFDSTGKLSCIITAYNKNGQNLNFCIPIKFLQNLVQFKEPISLAALQLALNSSQKKDISKEPEQLSSILDYAEQFIQEDDSMSRLYARVYSSMTDDKRLILKKHQLEWLRLRDLKCKVNLWDSRDLSKYDSSQLECILNVTLKRKNILGTLSERLSQNDS